MEFASRGVGWAPDGRTVLGIARMSGGEHAHLYRLSGDTSPPARVSDAALSTPSQLQISPESRWAAALDEDKRPVVLSLENGKAQAVPSMAADAVPRGWAHDGSLWVTEVGSFYSPRTRLFRVDLRTGKTLEERSIGTRDPGGASAALDLVLSPDGRQVAFTYIRNLGSLVIVRGLGGASN